MRLLSPLLLVVVILLAGCASRDQAAPVTYVQKSSEGRFIPAAQADAAGRQLRDAPHSMDHGMMDELRTNVPKFAGLSHKDIMWHMDAMGPNYTWYVSPMDATDSLGVLIMAHGFREHGDRVLGQRIQGIATEKPTALAMGMSMMTSDHIQLALNNLSAAGVERVVVVPAVSTRYNTMVRQWQYLYGLQDEAEYATVPRVASPVDLYIVPPLEDHPLVGETLLEYAAELSKNPAQEDVIIVAHGPVFEADNQAQLAMLGRIADYIAARSDYASISVATLQDDAVKEVREANIRNLRAKVSAAAAEGRDVIIITNLLGTRTVQASLRRDLKGLDYRFNSKGLIEHDNFIQWIEESVAGVAAGLQ